MESNQHCFLLHPKSLCIGLVWLSSFEFVRACQRKRPHLLLLQKPTFYNKRLLKNHVHVGTNVLWITSFFWRQWKTVRFRGAEMQISVAGCSWGVCFAAIAFSIVPAFCAHGIQLTSLSATSKVALHWSGIIVEFQIFAPLTNEKVCLLPFCDAWKHLPSLNQRKWDIRPYICIGHKKVCSWDLGSFAAIGAKYTVQTKFVLKENYSRYFCDDKLLRF